MITIEGALPPFWVLFHANVGVDSVGSDRASPR